MFDQAIQSINTQRYVKQWEYLSPSANLVADWLDYVVDGSLWVIIWGQSGSL